MAPTLRAPMALAATLLLVALLAIPQGAQAHASLRRADPSPGAALRLAPTIVQLWFSEPIARTYSALRVEDANGTRVDAGDLAFGVSDPTTMKVSLGKIGPGAYTVLWRVLSTVDAHDTQGDFAFIYDPTGTIASGGGGGGTPEEGEVPAPAEVGLRAVTLGAQVVMLGSYGFILLVWFPAVAGLGPGADGDMGAVHLRAMRSLLRLATAASLALPPAGLTLVGLIAWNLYGSLDPPLLRDFLLSTQFGRLWLVRIAAASATAAVGAWMLLRRGEGLAIIPAPRPKGLAQNGGAEAQRVEANRGLRTLLRAPADPKAQTIWWASWAALGIGLMSALATSLSSHAAATSSPGLPALADFIHLSSVSLWVGGLMALAYVALRHLRGLAEVGRARLVAPLVANFSALGAVAVTLVIATGVVQALLEVASPDGLLQTPYGWTLLAKVALVVPLVALGARNHFVLGPRLDFTRGDPPSSALHQAAFSRAVQSEAVLGAIILVAAALLTALTPPIALVPTEPPPATLSLTAAAGDLRLTLEISPYPSTPGERTFNVFLQAATATASLNVSQVNLTFTQLGSATGTTTLSLQGIHPTHFYGEGADLAAEGSWQVRADVVRRDAGDVAATFLVTVG